MEVSKHVKLSLHVPLPERSLPFSKNLKPTNKTKKQKKKQIKKLKRLRLKTKLKTVITNKLL